MIVEEMTKDEIAATGYNPYDNMENYKHSKCGDCGYYTKCSTMFIGEDAGGNTRCDFSPSRYVYPDGKNPPRRPSFKLPESDYQKGLRLEREAYAKLPEKKKIAKARYANYLQSGCDVDFGEYLKNGWYKEEGE